MPSPQSTYRQVVAAARAETLALTRASVSALERAYAVLLAALVEEAARATGERAERLTRRSAAVRAALARLGRRIESLEADAERAARTMGDGHRDAVDLVMRDLRPGLYVETTFEAVPERAVEALLRRRQIAIGRGLRSYAALFRSVAASATGGVLEEIDGVLLRGVARGADARTVAFQIAEALTEGQPGLRRDVERLAPSLQRSGRTLSGRGERFAEAEDLGQARQLLFRARRIARTEILSAQLEADRIGQGESPVVRATRWSLSGNHPPTGCECEVFAGVDLYDLGEGVFPTNAVPSRPHPHCGCYLVAVTRGPEEWGAPKPAASAPAVLERYPYQARPGGLAYTEAHKERVRRSVNVQLALAFRDVSADTPVPA